MNSVDEICGNWLWVVFYIFILFNPSSNIQSQITTANLVSQIRALQESNPREAIKEIQRVLEKKKNLHDLELQSQLYTILAECQFEITDWEQSTITGEIAHSYLLKQDNPSLLLDVYYLLAQGYEYSNSMKKGMTYYKKSYTLALQLDDQIFLSKLDNKLGHIHRVSQHDKKAIEYYQSAMDRALLEDASGREEYYRGLFYSSYVIIHNKNRAFQANEICSACYEIPKTIEDVSQYLSLDYRIEGLKDLYLKCSLSCPDVLNLEEVDLIPLESIVKRQKMSPELKERLDTYGEIAFKRNEYTLAEEYLEYSLDIAIDMENMVLQERPNELLKELYTKTKKPECAITNWERLEEIQDRIHFSSRRHEIASFEVKRAEDDVKKESLIEITNIKKRSAFYAIISAFLIGVISFIGYLMFRLNKQKKSLRALNNTKDQLFSIIAHDIRAPALAFNALNKKINYLIKKKDFESLDLLMGSVSSSANSLNFLLDNLLNWSLRQKDLIVVEKSKISLQEAILDIKEEFSLITSMKNIEIEISNNFKEAVLKSDLNILKIIIRNVLSNAIKYSNRDSMIKLETKTNDDEVVISIIDFGKGMTQLQIDQITKNENHKSRRGTEGEKGTGLGLNLASSLLSKIDGSMNISSKPRKGTTVHLAFSS